MTTPIARSGLLASIRSDIRHLAGHDVLLLAGVTVCAWCACLLLAEVG